MLLGAVAFERGVVLLGARGVAARAEQEVCADAAEHDDEHRGRNE
jgi:hypothetical protein